MKTRCKPIGSSARRLFTVTRAEVISQDFSTKMSGLRLPDDDISHISLSDEDQLKIQSMAQQTRHRTMATVHVAVILAELRGYKMSRVRRVVCWIGIISTLGALRLIFHWYPHLRLYATHKRCSFNEAHSVLIQEFHGKRRGGCHVKRMKILNSQTYRRVVYGLNEIRIPQSSITVLLFKEILNPFYVFEIFSLILWIIEEYYFFTLTIFILSLTSVGAAVYQARKTQKTFRNLVESHKFAEIYSDGERKTVATEVLVPGDVLVIPATGCLLMCDAVLVNGSCVVNESTLTGESVPVTKTPLLGEDEEVEAEVEVEGGGGGGGGGGGFYNEKLSSRSTLYCGTRVLQARALTASAAQEVLAVCIRTGFATTKGGVVRSVLHPPPLDFKLERDSYKFVACLAAVASVGFTYTVYDKMMKGHTWLRALFYGLDLITIVVPPALPAAMTVGCMHAQSRLKNRSGVFCLSPRAINVAGAVDCVCFDKTGTLTEDTLDMWGVIPTQHGQLALPVHDVSTLPSSSHLAVALASCHSLTCIRGKLAGDPMDQKMFESTKWVLEEPKSGDNIQFDPAVMTIVRPGKKVETLVEIGILKQLPFSSDLLRMSIICQNKEDLNFSLYCKGAPETVFSLCQPQSVPNNYRSILDYYTQKGYRVIAAAYRSPTGTWAEIKAKKRDELERDLNFLGLVVFENQLKPDCLEVMKALHNAEIRTIMITGDNLQTALNVGRECGMLRSDQSVLEVRVSPTSVVNYTKPAHPSASGTVIPNTAQQTAGNPCSRSEEQHNGINSGENIDLALTGDTWNWIRGNAPELGSRMMTRGTIFARMNPGQKQQLVQDLQAHGFCVAMVGDGANDCGALRAAQAGISLSEAEASAASPFTARTRSVLCVLAVIREGRAALITSFGLFKYMAAYSITEFVSVMLLYSSNTNFSDLQFLYIDLGLITAFAYLLSHSPPSTGPLVKEGPETSLLSRGPLLSLLGQLGVMSVFQALAFLLVPRFLNFSIFSVSSLQYILLALLFYRGPPHRAPMAQDWLLIATTMVSVFFTIYLMFYPADIVVRFFGLKPPDGLKSRLIVLMLGLANTATAIGVERVVDRCAAPQKKSRYNVRRENVRKEKELEMSGRDKSGSTAEEATPFIDV